MKVKDVMTGNPICCSSSDTAQDVARLLKAQNIGSVPVTSEAAGRLAGMITDRDLCCSIVAEALDPRSTTIERYITRNPVTCGPDDELADCERLMQEHQVRRIPVIDREGRIVGIVAQADVALRETPQNVQETVAEISQPTDPLATRKIA